MLEENPSKEPTGAEEQLLRPPAGRRSKTRPAGPPAPVTQPPATQPPTNSPATSTADEATTKPKTTRRATTRKKAEAPATTPDTQPAAKQPDTTATAEQGEATAPAAKKAPSRRSRTTRTAAKAPEAESTTSPAAEGHEGGSDDPVVAAIAAVMAQREKPARTTRTRASRKAGPAEPVKAAASADQATVTETTTDQATADEKPKTTRRRRATAKQGQPAPAATSESGEQGASTDERLDAALAKAHKAAPRNRRSKATAAQDEDGASDKKAALDSLTEVIAHGEQDNDEHHDDAHEQEATQEQRPKRRGRRAEPAKAEADHAEDDQHDEEHQGSPSDAEGNGEDSSEDEGEHGSHRRRRRRGGRRRRRSSEDSNDSEDNGEDSNGESGSGHEADADHGSDHGSDTDSNGTQHRRRRRRRRNGSDADSAELPVRVREPRHHGSDEVTGIEGSTRLEAKRQRRKEGRAAGRRRAPILSEAEFLARRESVDRKMIIRQREDYTQLAVLEDGLLVEHYVDRKASASLIGNIYLGKVQNVLPSMEAAFIDIGRGRNAVLYAGEVNWDSMEKGHKGSRRIEDALKPGQTVLVQASKDPIGAKGARLTGHISLPGRYVVYSPDGHLSGISRKLSDTERHRLKNIVNDAIDDSSSVIVRTAAEGVTEEALRQDVDRLKAHWDVIEKKVAEGHSPQQLYVEPDLTLRIVRDLFTEDFNELIVEGDGGPEDAFETVHEYVEHVAPNLADRLEHWDTTKGDLFTKYRIDEQISKALERKVFLPSGGSLVIDRTEAMTVIDVNTGKFTGAGGNLEETVTKNNLEAADEIVRQMRLRDLGGMIVVDFIDMVLPANRELLLRRLVECLGRDRTRHQVSEVTSLGLVQMTRKRIGTGLAEAFTEECETCGGRGYVRHDEPVASQAPADGGERHRRGGRRGGRSGK
ncbi:Rne/Rng family ribonuclease [Propionibacterium freudenreichii]|uniref:Rne/Rng family ribonuclease n=1 Tax=Propionibacterium freudenreichii TaxID=1744 RepID=UPI00254DA6DC|nr:Rne/Rng family ribonuclease [Propionibacterium freudenreichii]MDK9300776.1 Rne/Rng family ribonuclease [Propionibacterium freudenreichii]MDK9322109.1 Rne/Rng family ribonuclease [Propionibacterium freudenreichii]MDK9322918.1 Rne/Rng family ribonuclease [Propionibacterium freudenreichii]MDK9338958.1 Rne/Rng family ribonuclease [Propionibacterium freudenreichii]MDK9625716.1 Rne/Rng family ribonuclease [Propionibacterium freudenreichii]